MSVLVVGLLNIETTVAVDNFPIEYQSVRFPFDGIESQVSGVGVNNTLALTKLGTSVKFLSLLGDDEAGLRARKFLEFEGIDCSGLLNTLTATPQSMIQYDPLGQRQIYVDLKDIQESTYPIDIFIEATQNFEWLILGCLNICRPMINWAKHNNRLIACDLHTLGHINDEYHQDFLENSDVLFMSNENIKGNEYHFARDLVSRFSMDVLVIGMGSEGALLYERANGEYIHFPAKDLRKVINTVGAGDALFSAFMHFYCQGYSAKKSLGRAIVFASWKIGDNGASAGFLSNDELEQCYADNS